MYSTVRFTGQRGGRSEKSMKKWQRHRPEQQVHAGAELCLRALKPMQEGCREELRKGRLRCFQPKAEPRRRYGGVWGASGARADDSAGFRSPHSPRTAQASRARTASLIFAGLRRGAASTDPPASAPPLCVPCPFISRRVGQAQSLTSSVCAARLPNHPSSLPFHSSPPADHLIS